MRMLPRGVARCYGTNCKQKLSCARYKQIDLDKQYGIVDNWAVVITDSSRSGDECKIKIGDDL